MKRLLVILLLCGCSGVDSSAPLGVATDTLPSGAVRVTNSGAGAWDTGGAWRLTPELVLGEADGPDALLFASVSALQADDEGRIYVLDRQTNELRIFAPDGSHLRTVGRSGAGPGEYKAANGLLWIAPDTLLVVDQSGGRYSILTRDGDYVRSVPRLLGFSRFAFLGGYYDGRVYEQSDIGRYPDLVPALISVDVRAGTGTTSAVPDAGSGPSVTGPDTMMLPLPSGSPLPENFVMTNDQGVAVGYMAVPFSPGAVYYLDHDGSVWYGHGSEFQIVHSTLAGDTLMDVTLDAAPVPVSAEELEAWRTQDYVTQWEARAGPIDMDRVPRVKPFFDELYVDPDGNLWASVPTEPGTASFRLFDPDGRYLGRVQADGIERVASVPPIVRADRLYLVGQDSLGVERVHVFRIER